MPQNPQLIIHIGHPKCASTSVRELLWHNRAALARGDVFLIGDGFRLDPGNAIDGWPLWFLQEAVSAEQLTTALEEGLARLEGRPVRALVLSAENLIHADTAARLDGLVARYDTRILYYMRRQDHFLMSSWRQWALKRGIGVLHHVARRIAERKPDFPGTLAFWEKRVGRSAIHARFIDPRFLDGGALADDLSGALALALSDRGAGTGGNPSPDRAILLYLQHHPHLFRDENDDRPIQRLAALDDAPPRRLVMDRHLQRTVQRAFEADNQHILARFGRGGDVGLPVILNDSPAAPEQYQLTGEDRLRIDRILSKADAPVDFPSADVE